MNILKLPLANAGLWHADEEDIVVDLLRRACDDLNTALATGDCYKARLLLRLLAALTTANVISMQSFLEALHAIVSAANQIIEQGELMQCQAGTIQHHYHLQS